MSRIDELITDLCATGVEFRQLQDIFTTKGGYTPSKADRAAWTDGTVPWFRMEDLRENGGVLDGSLQLVNKIAVKGGRLFPANSILVATSATIGEHALITVPHLSNQRFTSLALRPEYVDRMDMKFVYYYCFILDEWCRNNTTVSSFATVDMAGFKQFKFPLPPLPIQREIVSVLDAMSDLRSDLEETLESEVQYRSRQYGYYRKQIVREIDGESVPIGELGRWQGGLTPSKGNSEFWNGGEIPWLASMDVNESGIAKIRGKVSRVAMEQTSLRIIPAPSVAVVMRSNVLRRRLPIGLVRVDTTVNQDVRVLVPRSGVNAEYVDQVLRTFSEDIRSTCVRTDGSMAAVDPTKLFAYRVPLPSLEEDQKRIAHQLRTFDTLMSDLSGALLAELDARRKQYEFYRNSLLTFAEMAV